MIFVCEDLKFLAGKNCIVHWRQETDGLDLMLVGTFDVVFKRESRIDTCLIYHWRDFGMLQREFDMSCFKVGYTDGMDFSIFIHGFQRFPCLRKCFFIIAAITDRIRPVDQVQIDIVGTKTLQGVFESTQCLMIAMAVIVQLGCQKQFISFQATVFECSSCCFLSFSITGNVKMTEACLNGCQDVFIVSVSMIFICTVSNNCNVYSVL